MGTFRNRQQASEGPVAPVHFLYTYLNGQKWPEARALFQRATIYANKAKNDTIVPDSMREGMKDLMQLIESKQFMAHANSILEAESNTTTNAGDKVDDADKSAIPLIDRLDDYFEDPNLVSGKPNLYPFPPNFEPIPCKPLFFDLAREHVEFPSLDEKISVPGTAASPQGASGGWLGGWLGGWSKK